VEGDTDVAEDREALGDREPLRVADPEREVVWEEVGDLVAEPHKEGEGDMDVDEDDVRVTVREPVPLGVIVNECVAVIMLLEDPVYDRVSVEVKHEVELRVLVFVPQVETVLETEPHFVPGTLIVIDGEEEAVNVALLGVELAVRKLEEEAPTP